MPGDSELFAFAGNMKSREGRKDRKGLRRVCFFIFPLLFFSLPVNSQTADPIIDIGEIVFTAIYKVSQIMPG